jgi:hypothetical protein
VRILIERAGCTSRAGRPSWTRPAGISGWARGAEGTCGSCWAGRAWRPALRACRTGGASLANSRWTCRTNFTLRAGGTDGSLNTLITLRAGGTDGSLIALDTLRTGGTSRASCSSFTLVALRAWLALQALITSHTLWAGGTDGSFITLQSARTGCAGCSGFSLLALRTAGTGGAAGSLITLLTLRTRRTSWPCGTNETDTDWTSRAGRPSWPRGT